MKLRLLLTLVLLFSYGALKAQTETYYTARVTGLTDQTKETSLNSYFSGLSGVSLFRADYRSETIYIIFVEGQFTEELLIEQLQQQNVSVICTVVQDNATNIRQKLMSKCFKEENEVQPQIEKR